MLSYSFKSDSITLGLYFPESDTWEFRSLEVKKNLPVKMMKYLVGPSYGVRSIHGEFFDARFEFDYYADEAAIK